MQGVGKDTCDGVSTIVAIDYRAVEVTLPSVTREAVFNPSPI